MKTSRIAVETSRSTSQSDSIARQTNKRSLPSCKLILYLHIGCFFFIPLALDAVIALPSSGSIMAIYHPARSWSGRLHTSYCYPTGRASAKILLFVWLCVPRVTRLDELLFEMHLERRIAKGSSSRCVKKKKKKKVAA